MTKNQIDKLVDYLKNHGYWEEDAREISLAYYKNGFKGVKEFMKSWDDISHDYTYEAIQVIKEWKKGEVK